MELNNVYSERLKKASKLLKRFKDEMTRFELKSRILFIEGEKWNYKFDYNKDCISVFEKKEVNPRILVVERAGI
jgi:hypothetical protein